MKKRFVMPQIEVLVLEKNQSTMNISDAKPGCNLDCWENSCNGRDNTCVTYDLKGTKGDGRCWGQIFIDIVNAF